MIDRKDVAGRIFALNRAIGVGQLARRLGITIPTLDRIVSWQAGREETYVRLLPALERVEAQARELRWQALLEARRRGDRFRFQRLLSLDKEAARYSETWTPLLRRGA